MKNRQFVWNGEIIHKGKTNAHFEVVTPIQREAVISCDKPWEKNRINYPSGFYDEEYGKYRLYYLAHYDHTKIQDHNFFICYAESEDGLHWVKPELGICEYDGSTKNNILLRGQDLPEADQGNFFDNFFCFKDQNPACPPEEKYKALAYYDPYRLSGYVSADGVHFKLLMVYDMAGQFDTLNTCFYDRKIGKYVAYVRGFHDIPENGDLNAGVRDIRRTESADFRIWSPPERLSYTNGNDYPLYTNNIMRYYRNEDLFIGFPTRYVERLEWTPTYDELCGKEARLFRMGQGHKRFGLAITDCILMTSVDGKRFTRIDEALFAPGVEDGYNWLYGDGYPAYFMYETPTADGKNKEISMLMPRLYNDGELPGDLFRYTFRRDGFACYSAPFSGANVVLKQTVFEGSELYINFSTSAKGSIYVVITDTDGNEIRSYETFGDSDNRRVRFADDLGKFTGKKVSIRFEMKDAKLYSLMIQ